MNNKRFSFDFTAPARDAVRTATDLAHWSLRAGRRAMAWGLIYLMIPLGVADMFAQEAPPPPPPDYQDQVQQPAPQAYTPLPPDQLNQLVAPIALYPDSLVAQILAASTFPNEIADADAFVQSHQGVPPDQMGQMVDGMNWDPSVKALIAFPTVLANLDRNINWTTQLGNAYYNQPQDVMSAVQVMRQRAYEAGNLRSNQQMAVTYEPSNIVIAPANPAVVYVPYYDPWVVYGTPVVAWGGYYVAPPPPGYAFVAGLAIGFGIGIAIASWNHWGWGWHSWGCGWGNHTIVYNRNVYISRSVTVINHGYYGNYDRNIGARSYNASIARTAPNYRPGYNGTYANSAAYRNSYNRTVTNNFNRNLGASNVRATNNNYNRVNINTPTRTATSNVYNRPGTTNTYSRPTAPAPNSYTRPAPTNGYSRLTTPNNYNRPTTSPNYNRPTTPYNYSRPTGTYNYPRPQAPTNYSRPATTNNYSRPPMTNNYSRPTTPYNYSRPAATNTYSRQAMTNNSYHPPSNFSRAAPQMRSAPEIHSAPQIHSSPQGHPSGGGHSHGR